MTQPVHKIRIGSLQATLAVPITHRCRVRREGQSPRHPPRHQNAAGQEPGNARLRRALYLPAMMAIRFNPLVAAFYARLVVAGKPKMAALGACMRKLLMIAYGVLKSLKPFDPAHGSKIAA